MALFGSKKKEIKTTDAPKASKAVSAKPVKATKVAKPAKTTAVAVAPAVGAGSLNMAGVILRPRITEKSGMLSQMGVYTFEVTKGANKNSVGSAVKSLYKVTPIKIAILNNPARNVFIRGRRGVVPGVRKALVTLKKGDKIDFV